MVISDFLCRMLRQNRQRTHQELPETADAFVGPRCADRPLPGLHDLGALDLERRPWGTRPRRRGRPALVDRRREEADETCRGLAESRGVRLGV